jgi:hypothetical protein
MAEDFAATLFTEARANHEAARRWFCIAAAGLAIFHVMIFRPYVDLTGKKAEAASGLASGTVLKQELDAMSPALARLSALSTGEAKRRLDGLLADLRSTFDRLNDILMQLRAMGADRAAGDAGAQLFPPPMSSLSMAVQMPIANAVAQRGPQPADADSDLPAMNSALRRAVAAAGSQSSVLEAIRPYIEEEIIAPRFSAFNDGWQSDVAPEVASAGDALLQRIHAAASKFPGEAASWTSAEQAVAAVVSATAKFKIEPPSNRFWWAAAESKDTAVHGFLQTLGISALDRAPALTELTQRTEAAITANTQQQAEIDKSMAALDEQFHEQQKELAEMVAPLKGIAIDLGTVVPYFPAILAAAFIALTIWLAVRIRELGEAVALVARGDPASPAPEWLHRRVAGSPWHRGRAIILRSVVLVAWVALASRAVASASLAGRAEAALFVAAAAIGLALAARYEWQVVRALRGA